MNNLPAEVASAVERRRRGAYYLDDVVLCDECKQRVHVKSDYGRWISDNKVLADHFLTTLAAQAERDAADEMAVDEAWLRSIGFVPYGRFTDLEIAMPSPVKGFTSFLRVSDSYGEGPLHFDTALWCVWTYELNEKPDTESGADNCPEGATIGRGLATTRGQLLRLLAALNITLGGVG